MTSPIEILAARIAAAMASGRVAKWDHLSRTPSGSVTEVFCKGCGVQIRRLETLRDANRRVYQVSIPTPDYAEMVILFDDAPGAKHVTHVCRPCAEIDWDAATLDAFFLCDVAAWTQRPGAIEDPGLRPMFEMQAHRHATGWRRPLYASESPHLGVDPVEEAS